MLLDLWNNIQTVFCIGLCNSLTELLKRNILLKKKRIDRRAEVIVVQALKTENRFSQSVKRDQWYTLIKSRVSSQT